MPVGAKSPAMAWTRNVSVPILIASHTRVTHRVFTCESQVLTLRTLNQDLRITVATGGVFTMIDGAGSHFIRSGENSQPIGKMTTYGEVQLYDASDLDFSIDDIEVKSGGQLELGIGLYTVADGPQLNPGTVTVESGGEIYNTTVSDIWFDTSIVIVLELQRETEKSCCWRCRNRFC